ARLMAKAGSPCLHQRPTHREQGNDSSSPPAMPEPRWFASTGIKGPKWYFDRVPPMSRQTGGSANPLAEPLLNRNRLMPNDLRLEFRRFRQKLGDTPDGQRGTNTPT